MKRRPPKSWLDRETEEAARDVARWPAWMKRAATLPPPPA